MDDAHGTFLREHTQAVLATSRSDGSPQVSSIVYDFDGTDIVVSVKAFTAKYRNAVRAPRVAMLVNDGHAQCIVYGTAEAVADDPERLELTQRVFERMMGSPIDDLEALRSRLDEESRTVLRITPERVLYND